MTGSGGYLGKIISDELSNAGHKVSGINRKLLYSQQSLLKKKLAGSDVIINLAGAPILQRWNRKNKKIIYDSRVITTENLIEAISLLPENERPKKFISASAIGIYKNSEHHNEESTSFNKDFVGKVVKDWEKALHKLPENIQQVTFRIGIVLGKDAKTIKNLIIPFKFGLGATIGNGKQPFPFIHEKDVSRAFLWAINEVSESTKFNLVAPENITNKEFTKTFAKMMQRPVFLFIPEFVFEIFYGEAANIITKSPSVSSEKIINAGFQFKHPDIESAILEIISKN